MNILLAEVKKKKKLVKYLALYSTLKEILSS